MKQWNTTDRNIHNITVGGFRVSVHHWIGMGDIWYTSCVPKVFDLVELSSKDVEDAKRDALKLLREKLEDALQDMVGVA